MSSSVLSRTSYGSSKSASSSGKFCRALISARIAFFSCVLRFVTYLVGMAPPFDYCIDMPASLVVIWLALEVAAEVGVERDGELLASRSGMCETDEDLLWNVD